jgi:hypothetical protein
MITKLSGFPTLKIGTLIMIMLAICAATGSSYTPTFAQTSTATKQNNGIFHSGFDTFVVPGTVSGYGVYEAHNSSSFKPGEKISLYIEPVGFSYKPVQSLYLMNFTADLLVSNRTGHVLAGFQDLPISTIMSHYKNKELILTVGLTQSNPFPPGDYVLKYIIHDVVSGNSFSIVKNIKIANT